jgi:hypothetical protein
MITFSRGAWISVIVPKLIDPCWSKKDLQFYATIYAAALEKHADNYASILAEIAVNKRLYPELKYSPILENALISLYE